MSETSSVQTKILDTISAALNLKSDSVVFNSIVSNSSEVKCLVGVSGGLDSMVLLDSLSCLAKLYPKQLILNVAHVNHKVRPAADRDQDFVANYCRKEGIPLHIVQLAKCPNGQNFEDWARRERYKYFNNCLAEYNLDLILTAHHADDQIETFLMRLISNKELRAIKSPSKKGRLLRPLLNIRRSELEEYASSVGVEYCTDETNFDNTYLRNRVRNNLLPYLAEQFGSSVVNSLLNQANNVDDCYRTLDHVADRIALEVLGNSDFGCKEFLDALKNRLNNEPEKLGQLVVRRIFNNLSSIPIGTASAVRLREFFCSEPSSTIEIAGGLTIKKGKKGISVFSRYLNRTIK